MKRFFKLAALAVVALVATSCGSDNSPKGVAEKAVACIQEKNYEGYVDLMYIREKEGENIEEQKKAFAEMLKSKADKQFEKREGIKAYEVTGETVDEDGQSAKVDMKITYGNGEEETQTLPLRKDDNGDWKLDAGK